LEEEGPMNTCQVCRRVHGRDKNDIAFCRGKAEKIEGWGEESRNILRVHNGIYENCRVHKPGFHRVYGVLQSAQRRGWIKSQRLRFKDPQKVGRQWDTMRFWGKDLTPILNQTLIPYVNCSVEK